VGNRHRVFRRTPGASIDYDWERANYPLYLDGLRDIEGSAGSPTPEAVAVGKGSTNRESVLIYDGALWTYFDPGADLDLRDVWRAGDGDYFLSGLYDNTQTGVVLRLRRN
jgi:hypothetical protein